MAETVTLAWIRGPGFGCGAVRAVSAPCSVRDFIHQHCQDQVRFAAPGRKGKEEDESGLGAERVCLACVCSLGFSFFSGWWFLSVKILQTGAEAFLCFCFGLIVVLSPHGRGKNPSAHRPLVQPSVWTNRKHLGILFLHP